MPKLPRQLRLPFRRPEGAIIAVLVSVATLFFVTVGWLEVQKLARRKAGEQISRLQERLGAPVEIGRLTVGLGSADLDDVRIGAAAAIVISRVTVKLALNPFGDNFGELDEVTVHKVRIKSPLSAARGQFESLGQGSVAGVMAADGASELAHRSLERLFAALPTKRLTLRSGGLSLVSEAGDPFVEVKGLEVDINRSARRALFKIGALRGPHGLYERFLQGRLELNPKGSDYRFFVRRKTKAGGKANAWSISGLLAKDLGRVKTSFTADRLPSLTLAPLGSVLGEKPKARVKGSLDLARAARTWRVRLKLQSMDTRIVMPIISTGPVGPVRFDLEATGAIRPDERLVSLESAKLRVPPRAQPGASQETHDNGAVEVAAGGTFRLLKAEAGGFTVQGRIGLPPSSCQTVLGAAPRGLLPALEGFKLSGSVAGGLALSYDSSRPDGLVFELTNPSWGCRVVGEPFAYSAEHLRGPFTLQREVDKGQEPIELSLAPEAPGFTPLPEVASSVNLAFIASEDAGFFAHHGIDPDAIENAVRTNLREGRVKLGGSTITMQTVKNLFLGHERTISRKLQELFLAWHLENTLTKERILEIYLNIVELGPGIFGVAEASKHYFGKTPFDLTLLESAYLANLLPSPKKRYAYFCKGQLTPTFTTLVHGLLKRMLGLGRITYERYVEAVGRDLSFHEPTRAGASVASECSGRDDDLESTEEDSP